MSQVLGEADERKYQMPKAKWIRRVYGVGLSLFLLGAGGIILFAILNPQMVHLAFLVMPSGLVVIIAAWFFETTLEGALLRPMSATTDKPHMSPNSTGIGGADRKSESGGNDSDREPGHIL